MLARARSVPRFYPPLVLVAVALLALVVYNLWAAALTDPGILPRNPPDVVSAALLSSFPPAACHLLPLASCSLLHLFLLTLMPCLRLTVL